MTATTGNAPLQWFAVRTKSNRERVVNQMLEGRDFEAWCPRYKVSAKAHGLVGKPMFAGYVFCRMDVSNRLPVLSVPGVFGIVSGGSGPLPISDSEIDSLKVVVDSLLPVEECDFLQAGDMVRVTQGPLAGAKGVVICRGGQRLVVSITFLQRSVCVSVQADWLARTMPISA